MQWRRTVTLGVCGGALAAWFAGAATSPAPYLRNTTPPTLTPIELRGEELAAEIARLRDRLRPLVEPQHPARNLFAYSSRSAVAPPRETPVAAAAIDAPERSIAPVPPLKLVGLAEDPGAEGPVRTAIISGLGQLHFVKEGDSIAARFRVQRISAEVVELVDLADAATHRLALK
jgi:hypothetical protein